MSLVRVEEVGRCSLIDVLEEAVLVRRAIAVELFGGASFIDEIIDVRTERGEDFAVFRFHDPVPVGRIQAVTRSEPRERSR